MKEINEICLDFIDLRIESNVRSKQISIEIYIQVCVRLKSAITFRLCTEIQYHFWYSLVSFLLKYAKHYSKICFPHPSAEWVLNFSSIKSSYRLYWKSRPKTKYEIKFLFSRPDSFATETKYWIIYENLIKSENLSLFRCNWSINCIKYLLDLSIKF